jgi:streptothricin hydrolase
MATALLLVDVQRNMLEGNTPVPAAAQVRPALQSLLARARTADALVVHIQNDGPAGSPDQPQTQGWELVFAPVRGELAIRKAGPDIFTADACLATTLTARGIDRVVVAGMQSNHCVEQASRGALRHGFTVLLASGAHATHDEHDSAAVISASVETALSRDGVTVLPASDVTFPS